MRATGSGAGCGNHWPLCNGTVLQYSASVDTIIEFTHRITSGLSFFSAVGLLIWTFAGDGPWSPGTSVCRCRCHIHADRSDHRRIAGQARSDRAEPVAAAARYLALHLTNTLLLLAALTLTAHMLSRKRGYLRGEIRTVAPFGADRRCPGRTCRRRDGIAGCAWRHAVSGDLAWIRTCAGFFFDKRLAGALAVDASNSRVPRKYFSDLDPGAGGPANHRLGQSRLSALVLILLAAQYVLGVLDVVLLAPVWLQVAHLLGADVLWAALVVLTARLTLQPVETAKAA